MNMYRVINRGSRILASIRVVQEDVWLWWFLDYFKIVIWVFFGAMTFYCDDEAMITYIEYPKYNNITKHINIYFNFIRNI